MTFVVIVKMFLNNLKKIRNEKGLKAQQLADMTGLSLRQIQRYDKGDKEIPVDNVLLLSKILNCNPTDILPNYNNLVSSSKNLKKLEIKINSLSNLLDNKTTTNEKTFNDTTCNIGNNLKKIREKKGISVRKMAKILDTSPSQIVYLENGSRALSLEWIEKFSQELDCKPFDILGNEFLGISTTSTNESVNDEDYNIEKNLRKINSGEILRELRLKKKYSTYVLANFIGVTHTQILHLENGRRKFTVEWANKIAPFLDVTPAQLLGFEPYNKISNNESVNDTTCNIGNNLKKLRNSKHLTQQKLADLVGVSLRHIQNLESGGRSLTSFNLITSLSKVLDCSTEELLGSEKIPKNDNNESLNNKLDSDSDITITSKKSLSNPLDNDVTLDKDIFPLNILTNIDDKNSINIPYIDETFQGDTISPNDKDIKKYVKLNKELIKSFIKDYKSLLLLKADECIITSFHFKKGLFLLDCKNNKIDNKSVQVFAFILEDMIRIEPLIYNDKKDLIETKINNIDKDFVIDLKVDTDFEVIGKAVASFNHF